MTKLVSQIIHEAIHGEGSWHNPIKLGEYEYKCHCGFHAYDTWVATYLCSKKNPNYLIHGPDWTAMIQWAKESDWWPKFNTYITKEFTMDEDLYHSVYNDVSIAYIDGVKDGVDVLSRLLAAPPALATKLAEFITDKEVGK